MSWLDGLSAALTAGTTGAAGWLEGQRKGQADADARAKQLYETLRQKRLDEQEELYRKAQMDRWTKDEARQAAQDARQGQKDIMEAQDAGYREMQPFAPTGSVLDAPFQQIADQQANNAITLGGKKFLSPLETSIKRKERERNEEIQLSLAKELRDNAQRLKEIRLQNSYKNPKTVWVVEPSTGKSKLVTEQTAMELGLQRAPTGAGQANNERAGTAAAFLGRLHIGKADFDNAYQFVRQYHNDLKTGKQEITPWMMGKASASQTMPNPESHSVFAPLSNLAIGYASGKANKSLAEKNADYQRYINLITAISTAVTEVMPRPNQALLGIEKGLSMAKSGDTPERIDDIQHRIDKVYEYLFEDPERLFKKGNTQVAPSFEEWLTSQVKRTP